MAFCLTKNQEDKLRNALVSGKLDPFKLAEMPSSEARRSVLEKFVDSENAANINSLFESKVLLKNQILGYQTWAKSLIGVKPKIKRDLLTKIERLNEIGLLNPVDRKAFNEDLVRTRLGFGVTFEEAKIINELSAERVKAEEIWEAKIKENPEWEDTASDKEWKNDPKRINYGLKNVALENYVNDLRLQAKKERVRFAEAPIKSVANAIKESPKFFNDLFKSTMASIDNSFFGRQGIKNLYGTPTQKRIWVKNFAKSFVDIAAELRRAKVKGVRPMDMIKADIYSRPNAMNGKYKAGNYRLNVLHEEAIPTSLPEKVPGFGRLFRAAETAFGGGALRMRADLADMLISQMDTQGINTLDRKNAIPAGNFVGSLTGRGSLGRLTPIADKLNLILWSARFFKSNVETVFAPVKFAATKLGLRTAKSEGAAFIEKKAAINMVSIAGHVVGLMMMAGFLDPESIEEDPRSTNFGRVKIFGYWTDMTGGMRAIAIMAARLVPTRRNGEWGVWKKSSTGKWINMTEGKFGQDDAVDVFMDALLLNRLAPVASILRDYYRGEMFGGEPFDIKKSIVDSLIPLSIQNVSDVKDEKFEAVLAVGIAEFFGLGVSTYKYQSNWSRSTSKEMKEFKKQVGRDVFKDANDSYNLAYNAWLDSVKEDPKYKELSEDGKKSLESSARSAIKKRILDEYGYDETKKPETVEELREKEDIKLLKPVSQAPENVLISLVEKLHDVIVPDVMAAEEWSKADWERAKKEKKPSFFQIIRNSIERLFGKKALISPLGEVVTEKREEVETKVEPTPTLISKATSTDFGRNPHFKKTKPSKGVDSAIRKASSEFDVPSELLFDIALQESSLNPKTVNTTPAGKKAGNPTGLFQFTDSTWASVVKFNNRKGSALYKKLKNTDRTDPETNAMAAAFLIHFGQLGKWDASEDIWGEFWTPEELEKMGFYKQTIYHKKGVRASDRLAGRLAGR